MTSHGDSAGRVLLICPRFFDYQERIARVLRRLGFEVVVLDDRPSSSSLYKIALRLAPALTARLTHALTMQHLSKVTDTRFDHVLVIKGEAMTGSVLQGLRTRFPAARFALYLWDAVRNNGNSKSAASLYDAVSTFDPSDAKAYGWEYRPLFAVPPPPEEALPKAYDWSFVGTLHSDRLTVLDRIRQSLDGRPYYVFGFYASPILAAVGRLKGWLSQVRPFGTVSTKPLDGATVRQVVAQSRSIADIEHPKQVGLTIRTIETMLAGRKLITTNRTIRQSALYDASRVCVIDRNAPVVPPAFLDSAFLPLPDAVRYGYSDECWARRTLGLPDPQPFLL